MRTIAAICVIVGFLSAGASAQNPVDIYAPRGLKIQYRNCVMETLSSTINATNRATVHLLNPAAIAEAGFQNCATEEQALVAGAQAMFRNNPEFVGPAIIQIKLEIKDEVRQTFTGAVQQLQQMR